MKTIYLLGIFFNFFASIALFKVSPVISCLHIFVAIILLILIVLNTGDNK